VLELERADAAILLCLARENALDAFPPQGETHRCRVAADELLLVYLAGSPDLAQARNALEPGGGIVLDHGDAFAVWTLAGDDAEEAFARLSAIELPRERPGFVQGAVAGVAAKAIAEHDRIHVLVSSALGHHVPERVRVACGDLELRSPEE
jgi:hypothetical protein